MDPNLPKASATRGNIVLTHRGVEALKPDAIAYRITDLRCPGLAVRVAKGGLKTWDVAYRVRRLGLYRRLSLSPFPAVSLDAARERAGALIGAAKAGRDLLGEERTARVAAEARLTVGQMVEIYLSKKVRGHLRSAGEMERRMHRAFLTLKHRFADELRRGDLRQVLDAVAERGAMREAQQQRQVMRVVFKWALSQDLLEIDPAAGIASYGGSPRRDRVLSAEEIRTFWSWLETVDMPAAYIEALKLELAMGARIGEIGGIRAEEIDQETWIWTLPADRSKNGRARLTPIVGMAKAILQRRLQTTKHGPLFPIENGQPLTSNCVASILVKRRKDIPIAHFTSHDLRRTVATGLVDLGLSYEVTAAVIGHEAGSKEVRTLLRHYVRSDMLERKQRALATWDAYLSRVIRGAGPPNNVLMAPLGKEVA